MVIIALTQNQQHNNPTPAEIMAAIRIFISSVQKEFSEERKALVKYIREDVLLSKFFQPFIFEELLAIDLSAPEAYLTEAYLTKTAK